ncbi:F-box/lrr-repeat protein 7-like [Plakobranchus ocellatus]|uniref:F-box/lrr-repeat protein 7-like n=1 Tax=Plakobranchus ocellatus TaxID=259542 RepID=A0AAV3ZDP1_9GAST|nr:F-box/lrr-repeat protein 7-like [Plakobranchus ocellatus]
MDVDLSEIPLAKNGQDLSNIHQGLQNFLHSIKNSLKSITFGSVCHDGSIYQLFGSSFNSAIFPALRSLDYSYSYVSPRDLRLAITTHPDIETLILCHTPISFHEAMTEALHLPNLKVLIFQDSSCFFHRHINVIKFHVMKVPKMCTKLEIVKLHTILADLDDQVIQQFTKHCPNLKSLSLTCSSNLSPDAFIFSKTSTTSLTSLELKDRQRTEPYLCFVVPWFPHLTHLAVSGHCVHLEDCCAIATYCPNLEELIFQANSSKNDRPQGIFGHILNTNGLYTLCGTELIAIVEKCKKLKKVHAPYSDIDDKSVVCLTEQCPHLEDVNFSGCHRLTKVSLLAFSKNSLQLKKLHFQESSISHEHLMNVLLKCRKLREVFFDRKSRVEMVNVPSQDTQFNLPRDISNVSLSNLDDIPYIDMSTSAEDELLFDKCDIENSSFTNSCSDLSFEFDLPEKVLHNYSPVKRLSLRQSSAEEKFLQAMVMECPSLTLLSLDGADALTDDLVITIAKNCSNLETLGLSLSVHQDSELKFGDRGLLSLVNCCRKLECLSFLNNRNITSGAVQLLFQALETNLSSLRTVSLCVGDGYACSPSVISLYGLKYLTEDSKKQLKSSTTERNTSFFIHLDFKRMKLCL